MPDLTTKQLLPQAWLTPLCPVGITDQGTVMGPCDFDNDRDRSAFFFQLFGTTIFIFMVVTVKGQKTGPSADGVLGPLAVCLCLYSQISLSALQGGACYNPAVALAQLTFSIGGTTDDQLRKTEIHYLWVYLLTPFIGATLAGIMYIFHAK